MGKQLWQAILKSKKKKDNATTHCKESLQLKMFTIMIFTKCLKKKDETDNTVNQSNI